jgi:hypothetical protein
VVGGRAGTNVGFLLELSTFGQADTSSGDYSLFASYKAHLNYEINGVNYGAVVFTTDTGGASYGFELLNTGAQRFIRVAEERKAISAQQFIGLGDGPAEGLALVASNDSGYVNLTFWTPDHGNVAVNGPAQYLRGVFMPSTPGWDSAVGFQYFGGSASRSAASGGDIDTDGWALDGQLQGDIGGKPVGFYATYGVAKGDPNNFFNIKVNDKKAWSLVGEWGVLPQKATIYAGYLNGDNGTSSSLNQNEDRRILVGATWMLAMNVEVQVWNVFYRGNLYDPKPASGGDNLTSIMLYTGF